MADKTQKYGASPAFFLSLYGDGFTPDDVCRGLQTLAELGLASYQGEIVSDDKLAAWLAGGAKMIRARADSLGLYKSQFVAHFLIDAFSDSAALNSDRGVAEIEDVMRVSEALSGSSQVTVPIGPFKGDRGSSERLLLADKLRRIEKKLRAGGFRMALEVQPAALVQDAEQIAELLEDIGGDAGFNFDTGHAWASGCADLTKFPRLLGSKILGTHLCDNDGVSNDSLRPNTGSIDWAVLLTSLKKSGYAGSLDLEIFCDKARVRDEYAAGLSFIRRIWGGEDT